PGCTLIRRSSLSHLPFAIICSCSCFVSALWPRLSSEPGSASNTYQHSVFPYVTPSTSWANVSSGCTCTDKSSFASKILTSSGYASLLSTDLLKSPPWDSQACANVCPFNGPFSITLGPFG